MREFADDPLRSLVRLAGRLGVEWPGSVEDDVAFTRSRMTGEYAVDEFGFDPEFTTKVFLPMLRPLAQNWFRVEVRGDGEPADHGLGAAGLEPRRHLPLDGMVLQPWSTTRSRGTSGCSART